jgi:hypothetical protein
MTGSVQAHAGSGARIDVVVAWIPRSQGNPRSDCAAVDARRRADATMVPLCGPSKRGTWLIDTTDCATMV